MINVSVRGIKCFSLNTENKSQASYKINIVMQDASDFRNTELYHIAENGESEKLTYTIENTDDGRQRSEEFTEDRIPQSDVSDR